MNQKPAEKSFLAKNASWIVICGLWIPLILIWLNGDDEREATESKSNASNAVLFYVLATGPLPLHTTIAETEQLLAEAIQLESPGLDAKLRELAIAQHTLYGEMRGHVQRWDQLRANPRLVPRSLLEEQRRIFQVLRDQTAKYNLQDRSLGFDEQLSGHISAISQMIMQH